MTACEMCSAPGALPATIYGERASFCLVCARDLGVEREPEALPPPSPRSYCDDAVGFLRDYCRQRMPDLACLEAYDDPASMHLVVVATVLRPDGKPRGDVGARLSVAEMREARHASRVFEILLPRLEAARAQLLAKGLA